MASTSDEARAEMGERIRQARRDRGLTQAALSRRMGVSLGLVDRLETGAADAARYLEGIAEATGKDLGWLRGGGNIEELRGELMRQSAELQRRIDELDLRVAELEHELYSRSRTDS